MIYSVGNIRTSTAQIRQAGNRNKNTVLVVHSLHDINKLWASYHNLD